VKAWRERFAESGLKDFSAVRPGRGRKPSIPDRKVEEIVRLTLTQTPPGETHWSCRTMAARAGVSPATVQRIWSARGLKPHRVDTFKLSNDPRFEAKLVDVVGLYLNPPENAIVLSMEEKSGSPLRLGVTSQSRRRQIPAISQLPDRSSAITSCTPRERAPSHSVRNLRGLLRPADLAPRRRPAFSAPSATATPIKRRGREGAQRRWSTPRGLGASMPAAQRALTTPYGRVL